jgi:hypothetical protein
MVEEGIDLCLGKLAGGDGLGHESSNRFSMGYMGFSAEMD